MTELAQETAFWKRYCQRLHKDERDALARGDGSILRPKADHLPKPRLPSGEWLEIRSNLHVKLSAQQVTEKGYRYEVTHLRDFRARFPRRTPSVFDVPDLDSFGQPVPPTVGAIEDATEAGNYTSSHALAVPDCGETVDPFTQKRITADARMRERQASAEMIVAAQDVLDAIRERSEASPDFQREARLTIHRMRRELDRFIQRQKRKAA